jgi:hypothetical protein
MRAASSGSGASRREQGAARGKAARRTAPIGGLLIACLVVACGGDSSSKSSTPEPEAPAPSIAMAVVNQLPIPAPCMGPSLTFFEGTTPVNVPAGPPTTVQVTQLFGGPYEIGFQVNGWYWRQCMSGDDCPNPNHCQNPDNAGQVAVQIASDCSSATLIQNFDDFTCDKLVPNASNAVTVTLQSQSPCTVVIGGTSDVLTPTDQCCSCMSCSGSQIPMGQTTHCQ